MHYFESVVEEFFTDDRFMHVYGKLHDHKQELEPDIYLQAFANAKPLHRQGQDWVDCVNALDHAFEASEHLNVIDPNTKGANTTVLKKAAAAIQAARVCYILGYGFDKNNNDRLEMTENLYLNNKQKAVMFTNFQGSDRINKAASRLFFRDSRVIGAGRPNLEERGGAYCEKSERNVYDALELDFDSLEDHFLATPSPA